MSMTLSNFMSPPGDDTYYEDAFLNIVDSHLLYLQNRPDTVLLPVDAHLVYKHEGDLSGLFDEIGYPKKYHYTLMRMNGFRSTNELKLGITTLIVPPFSEIDLLNAVYRTKKFSI